MIRVSTTTIEQFRKVCETDFAHEDELALSIAKPEEVLRSWQMTAGIAWDRLMTDRMFRDTALALDVDPVKVDDWCFSKDDIRMGAEKLGKAATNGTPQVKLHHQFDCYLAFDNHHLKWEFKANVVAKADLLYGSEITDVKARFSNVDPDDYLHDLQWQFYLEIFGGKSFRYAIFEMNTEDADELKLLSIKHYYETRFFPYEGMRQNCLHWLERFLGWANQKNLLRYLERPEEPQ